jgi:hypothetical protein
MRMQDEVDHFLSRLGEANTTYVTLQQHNHAEFAVDAPTISLPKGRGDMGVSSGTMHCQ